MGPRSLVAAGLIICLAGSPAAAEQADPGEVRVVYCGEPASPEAAGRVAAALSLLKPSVSLTSPPAHLGQVVPPDSVAALGARETAPCIQDPLDSTAYWDSLEKLLQATMALEDTRPLVHQIRQSQACLTEPVEARALAKVAYLEGVYLFDDGQREAARAAFVEVLTIEHGYEWDDDYSPNVYEAFLAALEEVTRMQKARLRVVAPAGTQVWIDGATVDAPRDGVRLTPGRHLVQLRSTSGAPIDGRIVILDEGADTLIIDPATLSPTGAADTDFLDAAQVLFDHLSTSAPDPAPTMLVSLAPEPAVWSWGPATKALTPLEMPSSAVAAARGQAVKPAGARLQGPHPVTAILLASGAGLLAAGGIMAGVNGAKVHQIEEDVDAGDHPFPEEDDPDKEADANYQEWLQLTNTAYAGFGLLAAGGTILVVSIPVGILTAGKGPAVSLSARLHTTAPPPGARGWHPAIDGVSLTLDIR
jgi:hypothetical protein